MILQKLKETTRRQHEEVEASMEVMNRMFSIEDYKALIRRFRKFYKGIESRLPIEVLKAAGFDYTERLKMPLLEADSIALGIEDPEEFEQLPDVSSAARAFGSLYVIEGSTLGGQVISRHLRKHLGITPANGGSFLVSYGTQVGPMWKEFGAAITAFAQGGQNDAAILDAASETFESVRKCVGNHMNAQIAGK